jgi:hypothetical protein
MTGDYYPYYGDRGEIRRAPKDEVDIVILYLKEGIVEQRELIRMLLASLKTDSIFEAMNVIHCARQRIENNS